MGSSRFVAEFSFGVKDLLQRSGRLKAIHQQVSDFFPIEPAQCGV